MLPKLICSEVKVLGKATKQIKKKNQTPLFKKNLESKLLSPRLLEKDRRMETIETG